MESLQTLKQAVLQLEAELLLTAEVPYQTPIESVVSSTHQPWLYDPNLSSGQRVMMAILKDQGGNQFTQSHLVKISGFTNKGVREMLEGLARIGYIKRGIKAGSWELA